MALIKCAECGKEFSDKASACPNCACPVRKKETRQNNFNNKTLLIIISIMFLMIICCIILVVFLANKDNKESDSSRKSIFGTYTQTNYHESGMINGELTLYENGSCEWAYWSKGILSGKYEIYRASSTYCSYDYTDDKVTISYTSYSSDIPIKTDCKYNNEIIDCGSRGTFEK